MNLLEAYLEICKIKEQAGLTSRQDVVKLVTEELAHQHYGGELIGGIETGRDIANSPTHGSVSVKGRPFSKYTRDGLPTKMTPLRTRHWNFDYIAAVLLEPDFNKPYEIIEYPMEYMKEHATWDNHDHRWELAVNKVHYKNAKRIKL